MKVAVTAKPFDPWRETKSYQNELSNVQGKFGATATFVGTMRDFNEGMQTKKMVLEHYPGMTEKHLEKIAEQAKMRWSLLDCLIIHRIGEVSPNDPIVLVAVWSSHRGAAFDACRMIMEDLKSNAPFWKKEHIDQGTRWVEKNTCGYEEPVSETTTT